MKGTTQNPFWQRNEAVVRNDITLLRPKMLGKGFRFESEDDAIAESIRSERILALSGRSTFFCETLAECRQRHYRCNQTFCPICARVFRRWSISAILNLIETSSGDASVMTVLLERSTRIKELDLAAHRRVVRRQLQRAGLASAATVGGFEMVYRASEKAWVLHVNLLINTVDQLALKQLRRFLTSDTFARPTHLVSLKNPVEQVSYLLKFTTYHRPFLQNGGRRSPAKPLNTREHAALVEWMSQYEFTDMLFLCGVRRYGTRLDCT